ncbi:MAG: mechanosensitive ion channel family protein, partial [bacterium]|nr:mechanosensitive ion channel family protein [bacterium]
PNFLRSILILFLSLVFAFFLSRFIARIIIRVAQLVAIRSDSATDEIKAIKLRRVETYLSVTIAIVRVMIIVVVGLLAWNVLSPTAQNNSTTTAIGASAFFIVLAGATIGTLLRDITAGATMIIEDWFGVGDHIKVEPFWDVAGVVERVTLRSTKLRSLNGEVIWMHNQHIQGAHVTPKGIRTMSVDVLINDKTKGMKLIEKVASTIPIGPTLITKKMKISEPEAWGDELWRVVITGTATPGRQWLMEDFLVNSLLETDVKLAGPNILVHRPIARYSDPDAERNFKRAVRPSS